MILSQMRGFADYGFPESHSVSFALIAYASSYLKCHYPAAFFAGLLNSQPMGFYSPHSLIQAARRHGVAILPVCVQKSGFECALEPLNTGGIKEYAIRLGLRMVTGLSASSARQIPQARSRVSTWNSWNDFLSHTIIPRHDLTALAAANAFASFGLSRRSAVWIAAAAPHAAWLEDVDLHSRFPEEDACLSIQQDFVSTGTSLYAHPAGFIRGQSWCYEVPVAKIKTSQDLSELIPNQIVTVFGMILIQQRPPSAKGMMFITLEDEFGFINVALTPDAVERIGHKIHQQSFLCLTGKLQRDGSSHSVLAKDIHLPRLSKADVIPLPLHKPDHYHPPAKAAMMNQYGNKT
jgi:error-prone DNA polymerase